MRRLHILVEGQTEEVVVRDAIAPYLSNADVYVTFSIYTTKRPAGGPALKGGLARWAKLRQELQLLLAESAYDRVVHVEQAMLKAVDDKRFIPHLVLHEIEAWVLADCTRLGEVMGDSKAAEGLLRVVQQEGGPEFVDDGVETAPA